MQHLNLFRFYELASKLHGLFACESQTRVADMFAPLTEAQTALDSLIKGDPIALESSKADATRLLGKIGDLFNKYFIDQSSKQLKALDSEERVNPHELAMIRSMVEKFEHALAAELNYAPSYIASKRGIYATHDLIENAHVAFSPTILSIIPTAAQTEFDSAGRALAFGMGTASVIHLLRTIETVLRQYFEMFAGSNSAKTERNYTIYLKKLTLMADDETLTQRPDRRILQLLAQIKDQYRNPLTTPENSTSIEQATALFGLTTAIVTQMAEQIQARQQAPLPALDKPKSESILDEEDENYDFRMAQTA